MKNYTFVVSDRFRANTRFALQLSLVAAIALVVIALFTLYTVRLDIAFLEANRMLKNENLRQAIFLQVFDFDSYFPLAFPAGLLANAGIAALFGLSQEKYFTHFRESLQQFSLSLKPAPIKQSGPLRKIAEDFMFLVDMRLQEGESARYVETRERLLSSWPGRPRTFWPDQIKFALIAGFLAFYVSSLAMILLWNANSAITDLSRQLARFSTADAAQFFTVQMTFVEPLGWAVVVAVTAFSVWIGVRFARSTSNASYAVARQLRLFLNGATEERVFLRSGDPGLREVSEINSALNKIEVELRSARVASSTG